MEHLGAWGLIPPLLTIALALLTKDVIISLFLGILSGVLIIAGGNPGNALMSATDLLADSLTDSWNIRIFLFCALLGGLVGMLARTGASSALGEWAAKHLKTRRRSLLMTWVFGLVIFIDDYFNSLTVGTMMRPLTDKHKVSRAKLAYILDSTAAPVCIIAPISSWVVTVMSVLKGSQGFESLGISEFEFFIRAIPYNMYALLTLLMVFFIALTNRDFGPMKKSEELARNKNILMNIEKYGSSTSEIEVQTNEKAHSFDMLLPIVILIFSALTFFPLTTWLSSIDGQNIASLEQAIVAISFADAFKQADASVALMYSAVLTITFTYFYFIFRGLLNIKTASASLKDGIASMVPALIILTMAWTIGSIIKNPVSDGGLGLAAFLSETVVSGQFPLWLLPGIIFVLSAFISFSTGTSWGTFTIMIPIVMPIAVALSLHNGLSQDALLNVTMIAIASVLSGAVFGDHASPISDTTILSSTGAACPHLEHFSTQVPYSIFVAVASLVGFVVAGISLSDALGWLAALAVFVIGLIFSQRLFAKVGQG